MEEKIPVNNTAHPNRKFHLIAEFDFFSQYISKGLPCSDGAVWQPSLTLEAYNAGVNIWANYVLDNEANQGQFNEVDITPYYNIKYKGLTFIPSVNFLIFMNRNPKSLNYSKTNIVRPQWHLEYTYKVISIYADAFYYAYPTRIWSTYHDVGLNLKLNINKYFRFQNIAQFAIGGRKWNERNFQVDHFEYNNFEWVFNFIFLPHKDFAIIPTVHIVSTISDLIREKINDPDIIWGGIMFKYLY